MFQKVKDGIPVLGKRVEGREGDNDPNLWNQPLHPHYAGEFSFSVVRGNANDIEDNIQVESGYDGTFVGVYDGHGGTDASTYVCDHLFPQCISSEDMNALNHTGLYGKPIQITCSTNPDAIKRAKEVLKLESHDANGKICLSKLKKNTETESVDKTSKISSAAVITEGPGMSKYDPVICVESKLVEEPNDSCVATSFGKYKVAPICFESTKYAEKTALLSGDAPYTLYDDSVPPKPKEMGIRINQDGRRRVLSLCVKTPGEELAMMHTIMGEAVIASTPIQMTPYFANHQWLANKGEWLLLLGGHNRREVAFYNIIAQHTVPLPHLPISVENVKGCIHGSPAESLEVSVALIGWERGTIDTTSIIFISGIGNQWNIETLNQRRNFVDGPIIHRDSMYWVTDSTHLERIEFEVNTRCSLVKTGSSLFVIQFGGAFGVAKIRFDDKHLSNYATPSCLDMTCDTCLVCGGEGLALPTTMGRRHSMVYLGGRLHHSHLTIFSATDLIGLLNCEECICEVAWV